MEKAFPSLVTNYLIEVKFEVTVWFNKKKSNFISLITLSVSSILLRTWASISSVLKLFELAIGSLGLEKSCGRTLSWSRYPPFLSLQSRSLHFPVMIISPTFIPGLSWNKRLRTPYYIPKELYLFIIPWLKFGIIRIDSPTRTNSIDIFGHHP